ncbi:MAG TPA: hypothetical protein VND80_03825 [Steroidobacteraceae bacterium]|nr:hypothetical protein [Steroidobacteraceae bacterium]
MSEPPTSVSNLPGGAPRFDRAFIDEHRLLDRYLDGKLPFKGAREFERWCAEHPEYLEELNLPQRTQATLQLLEASGRAPDLAEPRLPWWRAPWFAAGLGVLSLLSLAAFWALLGNNLLLRDRLTQARARLAHGSMQPPSAQRRLRITPDRSPGIDQARFSVNHTVPTLVDLRIDMGYVKQVRFRVAIDKRDQGRALSIRNIAKDSNGDLRLSFNTSALASGRYDIQIDGLPFFGAPVADGWMIMNVR